MQKQRYIQQELIDHLQMGLTVPTWKKYLRYAENTFSLQRITPFYSILHYRRTTDKAEGEFIIDKKTLPFYKIPTFTP